MRQLPMIHTKSTHRFSSLSTFLIHLFINSFLQFPSQPAHTTAGSVHIQTSISTHTTNRSRFPTTQIDSLNHNSHQQFFILLYLTIQNVPLFIIIQPRISYGPQTMVFGPLVYPFTHYNAFGALTHPKTPALD